MLPEGPSDSEQPQETRCGRRQSVHPRSPGQAPSLSSRPYGTMFCRSSTRKDGHAERQTLALAGAAAPWSLWVLVLPRAFWVGVTQFLNFQLWGDVFWAEVGIFVIYMRPGHLKSLKMDPRLWSMMLLATIPGFPKTAGKMLPSGQSSQRNPSREMLSLFCGYLIG